MDPRPEIEGTIEGVPAPYPLYVRLEVVVRKVIIERLVHPGAEEAELAQAHQAVDIGPGTEAAISLLNSPRQRPGEARRAR